MARLKPVSFGKGSSFRIVRKTDVPPQVTVRPRDDAIVFVSTEPEFLPPPAPFGGLDQAAHPFHGVTSHDMFLRHDRRR
ncbi:hypothetical protein M8R20_14755 [Pseudomonas sp. R2.Fl]|nr:hypothetical protein [Pseudomonas sp. R2.Fl]